MRKTDAAGTKEKAPFTAGLRYIADAYIPLGIITATDSVDEVTEKAWTPPIAE